MLEACRAWFENRTGTTASLCEYAADNDLLAMLGLLNVGEVGELVLALLEHPCLEELLEPCVTRSALVHQIPESQGQHRSTSVCK